MVKQKRKLSQKQVLLIFCTVLVILTYIAATFPQPFLRRGTEIYGIHFAYTEDVQYVYAGLKPASALHRHTGGVSIPALCL